MTTIQELKAVVTADTKDYDQKLGAVGDKAETLAEKTGKAKKATLDFGDASDLAGKAASAFGLALGAHAIVSFGQEAIQAANSLEKTDATIRAISGSQERYDEVLRLASAGQQLYGGTIQENLEALRGLIPVANQAGLSLSELDNVSRRLALASPEQGLEGASFAIKEFLASGDTVSLVERFELSRGALNALKESAGGDIQARLQGLNALIADLGFDQEVLAAQTETTANTYDRLGASVDNAKIAFGQFLADGLEPAAEGATRLFDAMSGRGQQETLIGAISLFKQMTGDVDGLSQAEIELASNILNRVGIQSEAAKANEAETAQNAAGAYNAYAEAYGNATDASKEHTEAVTLSEKELQKLETQLERTGERGATAWGRLQEAQQDYARDTTERQQEHARDIEDIQRGLTDKLADLDQEAADRRADIQDSAATRWADIVESNNTKLLDLQTSFHEQREESERAAAATIGDILTQIADLQDEAQRDVAERAQDYADKLADIQTRAADAQADRAQDHADKLSDLQARLAGADTDEERARIERQIAEAEREYAQKEARAARDLQRQQERLERERTQEEAAAAERLARQEQALRQEIQQEQAAYVEKAARQQEQYDQDRAAALVRYSEQLSDSQAQHEKELAALAEKDTRERAQVVEAAAQKAAEVEAAFVREETQRAAAFERQENQLKESLGRQLQEYITTQEQMSLISEQEAARRLAAVQREFGVTQGDPNATGFAALAAGSNPTAALAAQTAFGALGQLGLSIPGVGGFTAGGGFQIGNLTITIPGITDPTAAALAVRDELLRLKRENGGDIGL